ncbi:MAG: type III-D CRISPR-associated protein Csx19 [Actinomycetes bacterium]
MTVFLQWSAPAAPVTISELLDVAGEVVGPGAIGMISSPAGHDLVRFDGGQLTTSGGPAELADVFHLRLFTPEVELRWVHSGSRQGAAVALSESGASPAGWTVDSAAVEEVLDGQYALWGRRFETLGTGGWCRAIEGRIGWIDIPAAMPAASTVAERDWPEEFLAVRFREYLTSDEFGNAAILDERLIDIVVAEVQFSGEVR